MLKGVYHWPYSFCRKFTNRQKASHPFGCIGSILNKNQHFYKWNRLTYNRFVCMLCWAEDTCVANAASHALTHASDDLLKVGISKVAVGMLFYPDYHREIRNTLAEIPQLFAKLSADK